MATSDRLALMSIKFAESVPKKYLCCLCHELLTDPSTTSCCQHHFCYNCISRIQEIKRPCPKCKKESFSVQQDSQMKERTKSLKVFCPMSSKRGGCGWIGTLGELDNHLRLSEMEGECRRVHVKCPLKCGEYVPRGDLDLHKSKRCTRRQFECVHCGFKDFYEKITLKHYHECLEHPVMCPNDCHMPGIKRHQLSDHLSLNCPLRTVPCEFHYAGCNAEFIYRDLGRHLEEDVQKHLTLVSLHCRKLEESNKELVQKCSKIEGVCMTLQREILRVSADYTELRAEMKRHAGLARGRFTSLPNGEALCPEDAHSSYKTDLTNM